VGKTVYFTASTVNGFLASDDHDLSWLLTRDIDQGGPGGGEEFFATVGAMVMGSSTYRWILDHEGADAWEYDVPCWVFTHRDDLPVARRNGRRGDIRFTRADVADVHAEMSAAAGGRDLWMVGGGDLAGQFADAGLLDEVIVSFAPVTLASGRPLLPRHVELELLDVARNRDFVVATYRVGKR